MTIKAKIVNEYGKQEAFAAAMGSTPATISNKIRGKLAWRSDEIEKACFLLGIKQSEIGEIFFPSVKK